MNVKLINYTPLWVASEAIRTCWQSQDKSDTICDNTGSKQIGKKDIELIERVAKQFRHESTIEHLVCNFEISGISRALLQELARHRVASYSVQSSRYTLGALKKTYGLLQNEDGKYKYNWNEIEKFIVLTGDERVDTFSADALIRLKNLIDDGVSNDKAKYAMPECFKTSLRMTINMRSLRNFLGLRSKPSALWEIRQLSQAIFDALPEEYKFLAEDMMYKKEEDNV